MKTKSIEQTITFKASPKEVYEMIMDSKKHQSLFDEKFEIKNGRAFFSRPYQSCEDN